MCKNNDTEERLVLCFNSLLLASCYLTRSHMWCYFGVELKNKCGYHFFCSEGITWSGLFPRGQ